MARANSGARAVLLGPDTRYGARATPGFKRYIWYAEYFERGRRRLRSLGCEHGVDHRARLATFQQEVASALPAKTGAVDAPVVECINEYLRCRLGEVFEKDGLARRCATLGRYFARHRVSELHSFDWADYTNSRPSTGTARLELSTLKSALILCHKKKIFSVSVPKFTMPQASDPRSRVYSRSEIARVVNYFRRRRHSRGLAVAVLIAYYTGARMQSVLDLRWHPSELGGWIDLGAGLMHLRPMNRRKTNKKKPTIMIPVKLKSILTNMKARQKTGVLIYRKEPGAALKVGSMSKSWRFALDKLQIHRGEMHCLRHTRITHMIAGGIPPSIVSEYVGASIEMILRTYAHLQPEHGGRAANFRK